MLHFALFPGKEATKRRESAKLMGFQRMFKEAEGKEWNSDMQWNIRPEYLNFRRIINRMGQE